MPAIFFGIKCTVSSPKLSGFFYKFLTKFVFIYFLTNYISDQSSRYNNVIPLYFTQNSNTKNNFNYRKHNRELKQATFLSTQTPVRAVMEWVEYDGFCCKFEHEAITNIKKATYNASFYILAFLKIMDI